VTAEALLPGPEPDPLENEDRERARHALRRRFEGLLGIPATEGNRITVLRNGDEIFPAMLGSIRAAERSIDFLTFVYWTGDIARELAEALAERAAAGVRVRVLLDAVGGARMDRELVHTMRRSGVLVEWFRKPWRISPAKQNHRTHRKLLLCDERVGYTGGVGIAEEWCGDARHEGEWRDTHVRVEGPAVDGLAAAFAQNWAESDHPLSDDRDLFPEQEPVGDSAVLVARGSATVGWNDMSTVFRILIESARTRLRIATAYFIPDPFFEELLMDAVRRGVQVQLLLPGPGADKRVCQLASESTYARLQEVGVEVWNFQPSMLHAKIATVDGLVAVIGSANMNRRSMAHDEEVVLVVLDDRVTAQLDGHFDDDLRRSVRISPARWQDRPMRQRVAERATTVVHRWL
jgi:cardiolipin synthase